MTEFAACGSASTEAMRPMGSTGRSSRRWSRRNGAHRAWRDDPRGAVPGLPETRRQWIAMCSVETAAAHADTYPARKSEYGPDLAALIEQGLATKGTEIAASISSA